MKSMASAGAALGATWESAVESLGLDAVAGMLEDHAASLASEMLGGQAVQLNRVSCMGLPVVVPVLAGDQKLIEVSAPGEGGGLEVSPLLAGLAITAHAAEYLYFGADSRFATAQRVKAYKYLVQAEAMRSAREQLSMEHAELYAQVLGLDW